MHAGLAVRGKGAGCKGWEGCKVLACLYQGVQRARVAAGLGIRGKGACRAGCKQKEGCKQKLGVQRWVQAERGGARSAGGVCKGDKSLWAARVGTALGANCAQFGGAGVQGGHNLGVQMGKNLGVQGAARRVQLGGGGAGRC